MDGMGPHRSRIPAHLPPDSPWPRDHALRRPGAVASLSAPSLLKAPPNPTRRNSVHEAQSWVQAPSQALEGVPGPGGPSGSSAVWPPPLWGEHCTLGWGSVAPSSHLRGGGRGVDRAVPKAQPPPQSHHPSWLTPKPITHSHSLNLSGRGWMREEGVRGGREDRSSSCQGPALSLPRYHSPPGASSPSKSNTRASL